MAPTVGMARTSSQTATRGSNLVGVRAYNERLILSLVRRRGKLAQAELARLTGLSAQTVSMIVRALERDGLLRRLEPRRGGVGQPSVPWAIDPDGAYSLGLKIGRRSAQLVFMDFGGTVRESLQRTYPYPVPDRVLEFLEDGLRRITAGLSERQRRHIAGLGVAMPSELWSWHEEIGAPAAALEAWREFDISAQISARHELAVCVSNDATAACGAELTFGLDREHADYVYIFVGAFVGGGIVLGRSLYAGRFGNAGSLGSMLIGPIGAERAAGARRDRVQLIAAASLVRLEERLRDAGHDPTAIFASPSHWQPVDGVLDEWMDSAAEALAEAVVASAAVIDFGAAIIDGAFPPDIRRRLVAKVRDYVARMDRRGLMPVDVLEGSIGSNARAIGGASLPFQAKYLLDRDVLFKEAGS